MTIDQYLKLRDRIDSLIIILWKVTKFLIFILGVKTLLCG